MDKTAMGWIKLANQFVLGVVLGVHVPDMINDEAGSRNKEVVHPVKAPTDRLGVNSVMRDSSTGLINHLMNTDKEESGRWTWAW